MRIVSGSGNKRSTTTIVGGTRNAQGHVVRTLTDIRNTVGRVIKNRLFPTNADFHKAKRRGDRAGLKVRMA